MRWFLSLKSWLKGNICSKIQFRPVFCINTDCPGGIYFFKGNKNHFLTKNCIFGYRFHFEGKNEVWISQVGRVNNATLHEQTKQKLKPQFGLYWRGPKVEIDWCRFNKCNLVDRFSFKLIQDFFRLQGIKVLWRLHFLEYLRNF